MPQRAMGELDRDRALAFFRGGVDPMLRGDLGVAAAHRPARASLRHMSPLALDCDARDRVEGRPALRGFAAHVDSDVIEERTRMASLEGFAQVVDRHRDMREDDVDRAAQPVLHESVAAMVEHGAVGFQRRDGDAARVVDLHMQMDSLGARKARVQPGIA